MKSMESLIQVEKAQAALSEAVSKLQAARAVVREKDTSNGWKTKKERQAALREIKALKESASELAATYNSLVEDRLDKHVKFFP